MLFVSCNTKTTPGSHTKITHLQDSINRPLSGNVLHPGAFIGVNAVLPVNRALFYMWHCQEEWVGCPKYCFWDILAKKVFKFSCIVK